MHRRLRKTFKWSLIAFAVLVVLFLLELTALAFPQPLFNHHVRYGNVEFYCDLPIDLALDSMLRGVPYRLAASELYTPEIVQHVFICKNPSTYNVIRRLALVPEHVPGFNLSILNNSFISVPMLDRRRETNRAGVVYSTLSGDIGHSIAHEVMHDYMAAHTGFFATRGLPRWKTEGYAEYAASIVLSRADSSATLPRRIEILQTGVFEARAHDYYQWGLVVEYLAEIEGLTYDAIMGDSVTLEQAKRRMLNWQRDAADPV